MSQLSSQSIYKLCDPNAHNRQGWRCHPQTGEPMPMISPFLGSRKVINGKSAGLSGASYDLRIAHDLVLGPHPGFLLLNVLDEANGHPSIAVGNLHRLATKGGMSPCFALANTVENFSIPLNVSAQVCDKSTYARLGVSCFNTFFDPGFIGNGTLELVNLSHKTIIIREGDPICQMVFNWLDEPTERSYAGKYQFQPAQAVPAILEDAQTA